jgi:hypothetical protein
VAAAVALPVFMLDNLTGTGTVNSLDPNQSVENPLALPGGWQQLVAVVAAASMATLVGVLVAGIGSLIRRYRRATGALRQQLKWFGAAAILVVLAGVCQAYFWQQTGEQAQVVTLVLFAGSLAALPVATAVAVLRYRLYDLDLIIRKTFVYGIIVVVLGLVYLVGIAVGGRLLQAALGRSDALAVTLTTLAVALLFHPVRRRTQDAIDRRFSRRRADAARAIDAFGAQLRENLDLDALEDALLAAVAETVSPNRVELWLRR